MGIKFYLNLARATAFFGLSSLVYAVFSVVHWNFDPADWHIVTRIVYCIIVLVILNNILNTKLDNKGNIVK